MAIKKQCKCCEGIKPTSEFHRDRSRTDGYHPYCKPCKKSKCSPITVAAAAIINERAKQHYRRNKKEILKTYQQKYLDNKETIIKQTLEYYYKNREDILAHRAQYRKTPEGKAKMLCYSSKRRSFHLNATPPWFDAKETLKIYERAKILESQDNVPRHVDHIVPLINNKVCGLHCHQNLQILTKDENLSKGNKFEGE